LKEVLYTHPNYLEREKAVIKGTELQAEAVKLMREY
jgi:hypothetical protein